MSPLVRESKIPRSKGDLPIDDSKEKKSTRGTASERHAAEIGEALHEKTVTLFAMLNGFMPVTSVYAVENSEKAVNALVNIGKRNPKILSILAKAANGVDALEVGKFIIGILVCVQVDTGRARGDEFIAKSLGVTDILREHFWENEGFDVNDAVLVQDVPRFAAV